MDFSHLQSSVRTDVGRKRTHNEDAVLTLPDQGIFCVCDGMGGAAMGEVASGWAVEEMQKEFTSATPSKPKADRIRRALNTASRRIKQMAEERGISGTGTTAVVLFFDQRHPDKAAILHAGDSRAYRLRRGKLEAMTIDHSMATAAGVKHERSLPAMFRGVITRAVGLEEGVVLEETPLNVAGGDIYLLCSDGLSKMIPHKRMQKLLQRANADALDDTTRELIDTANEAGGDDNISAVLVAVSKPLPDAPPDTEPESNEHADLEELSGADASDTGTTGEFPAGSTPGESVDPHMDSSESLVGTTPDTGHGVTASALRATQSTQEDLFDSPETKTDERGDNNVPLSQQETLVQSRPRSAARRTAPAAPGDARVRNRWGLIGAGVVILVAFVVLFVVTVRKEPPAPRRIQPDDRPPADELEEASLGSGKLAAERAVVKPSPPEPQATTQTEPKPVPSPAVLPQPPPAAATSAPDVPAAPPAQPVVAAAPPEPVAPPAPEPVAAPTPEPEVVTPVEKPQQPPAATAPAPKTDEEILNEAAAELQSRIDQAMSDGSWGAVAKLLDADLPSRDRVVIALGRMEAAAIWVEEWKKANRDSSYAVQSLARNHASLVSMLNAMGMRNVAATPPSLPTQDTADAYCRELLVMRQLLLSEAETFLARRKVEIAALGTNPSATLASLHQYAFTSRGEDLDTCGHLLRDIQALDAWVAESSAQPIPLVGLMNGPAHRIPAIVGLREQLWNGIITSLDLTSRADEVWLSRSPTPAKVVQVSALRETILKRYRARRDGNASLNWPLQGDLDKIETVLSLVSELVRDVDKP